ncbi:hypothetical protein [Thermomonas sp.]|uniref:hypothetical protein n=1 Tax=Thermomonas sp. TaxID=1971895 RepID=UPI0035AEF401
MNAGEVLAFVLLSILLGMAGGILKMAVDGSNAPRLVAFGALGGLIASSMMGLQFIGLIDIVLLVLCGFLAADVFEAMTVERR